MNEIVISPRSAPGAYWAELWSFRQLFFFITWRDVLVRYKQTFAGLAWALLRPFLTMVVFVFVFQKVIGVGSGSAPYPLMVLAALLPWQFVTSALADCGNSLVGNANLIAKVYFPRLVIPASSVIAAFLDFLTSCGLMSGLLAWYGYAPSWRIATLPGLVLLAATLAFAAGIWIATVAVQYRDVRFVLPFVVQLGFFLSPVAYEAGMISGEWRWLYALNPMVGIIEGFRWAILGQPFPFHDLVVSIGLTGGLLLTGVHYFRRKEGSFADYI